MKLFQAKICGITRPEDAAFVVQVGQASDGFDLAVGLNFYKSGKRYVEPALAAKWDLSGLQVIGVFVNESAKKICEIARVFEGGAGLQGVQLHGDEKPEIVGELREWLPPETLIIRAVRTTGKSDAILETQAEVDKWVEAGVDSILLDAAKPGSYGGTGTKLDWKSVGELKIAVPWILAGGLNADNVAEAIGEASPSAVDVASGVESEPGVKDQNKVKAFVENAKTAKTA